MKCKLRHIEEDFLLSLFFIRIFFNFYLKNFGGVSLSWYDRKGNHV